MYARIQQWAGEHGMDENGSRSAGRVLLSDEATQLQLHMNG